MTKILEKVKKLLSPRTAEQHARGQQRLIFESTEKQKD